MALSDVMSMYAPQASLEAKFPGFRACFGGEELRRAEAAMSSKLVGGTIEALLASDMPPSLAQLTNHSKQLDRQATLVNPPPTSSTRQFDRLFSFAPSVSPIQAQTRADPSASSSPAASPRVTPRVTDHGVQAAGVSELDHLAHMYQLELERLGVVPSTNASATGIDRTASAPPAPSGSGPAPLGSMALPEPPREGPLAGGASQPLTTSPGYASACFEATYSCGLVLQDLAARCVPGSEPHQTKLQEACDMYSLAVRYRPTAHSALYNWGVALSDLARAMRPTDPAGAKSCLEAACQRYSQALAAHPDTPQALNNWGLVLQELSGLARGRKDRDALLRQACGKFRQAVRLRPEFDRGVYNLGTVCYAAASTLQGELAATAASPPSQQQPHQPGPGPEGGAHGAGHHHHHHQHHHHHHDPAAQRAAKEAEVRSLFTSAAQYIVLAYALQQSKEIYRKSLGVVRRLLPLPFLRAGFLTACIPSTQGTPEEAWRQDWFILDAFSLRSATGAEGNLSVASLAAASAQGSAGLLLAPQALALPLERISHVSRLHDPTLPKGEAFVVVMHGAQLEPGQEVVLVAENEDSAEGWVDVLTLAAHCVQSRATEALSEALTPLGGAAGQGAIGAHGLP